MTIGRRLHRRNLSCMRIAMGLRRRLLLTGRWMTGGGHSLLTEDGVLYLGAEDTEIKVRATLKDHPEIFDTVTIRRKSWGSFLWLILCQQIERRFLRFIWRKKKKYLHLRWKYIKDI